MHSMQPVYGQTKGLGNKTITRAVQQALEQRQMERDYLPEELRSRYELAEYNYADRAYPFSGRPEGTALCQKTPGV